MGNSSDMMLLAVIILRWLNPHVDAHNFMKLRFPLNRTEIQTHELVLAYGYQVVVFGGQTNASLVRKMFHRNAHENREAHRLKQLVANPYF